MMINEDLLLNGREYGGPITKVKINDSLKVGLSTVLDLEVSCRSSIFILILPPSWGQDENKDGAMMVGIRRKDATLAFALVGCTAFVNQIYFFFFT